MMLVMLKKTHSLKTQECIHGLNVFCHVHVSCLLTSICTSTMDHSVRRKRLCHEKDKNKNENKKLVQ